MRRASVIIGYAQAIALSAFAVSVLVNARRDHSTVGKPVVMVVIFLIFAGALGYLAHAIGKDAAFAVTPFGLLQVFAGIVGYTVMVGSSTADHVVGAVVLASALVGLVGLRGLR